VRRHKKSKEKEATLSLVHLSFPLSCSRKIKKENFSVYHHHPSFFGKTKHEKRS